MRISSISGFRYLRLRLLLASPTFAFRRRICDDPAFIVELPSDPLLHVTVLKGESGVIHNLVQEWTDEWLARVGARRGVRGLI